MGLVLSRDGVTEIPEGVGPVQYTAFDTWRKRAKGGKYVIKRLQSRPEGFQPDEVAELRAQTESYVGAPDDWRFGWPDKETCGSGLVWKMCWGALQITLRDLQRLGECECSAPNVFAELRRRYGGESPVDEPVVAPSTLFGAKLLVPVPHA